MRDAFHEATVAHESIGMVIDDGMTVAVEFGGQHFFGNRHSNGVGDALAERAGGRFDAGGVAIFRVTRRAAVQLTELFEVFDAQVVAAQVEQRVEQHRAVAVRQHEAVAVWPGRVGRIVAEMLAPEHFGNFGHTKRHAGMAGVGLLDGVHGQGANGAGNFVIGRRCGGWASRAGG